MSEFCVDLNSRARAAVEEANRRRIRLNASRRGNVGEDEKESVEEFLARVECISGGCMASAHRSNEGFGREEAAWTATGAEVLGYDAFGEFEMLDG